jgi:hypothetical protein
VGALRDKHVVISVWITWISGIMTGNDWQFVNLNMAQSK